MSIRTCRPVLMAIASVALIGWLGRSQSASRGTITTPDLVLERTTWMVTVTPDPDLAVDGQRGFTDTITFRNHMMTRAVGRKQGFRPALYAAAPAPNRVSFTSQQESAKQGSTAWSGEIAGQTISGHMVWTSYDGANQYFVFQGQQVF